MNNGKMQYPRMATLWKNEILPPNVRVLKVTMTAPPKAAMNSNKNSVASNLDFPYY